MKKKRNKIIISTTIAVFLITFLVISIVRTPRIQAASTVEIPVVLSQQQGTKYVEGAASTSTPYIVTPTTTVTPSPTTVITAMNGLILTENTIVALHAAMAAQDVMPGPYSWEEYRHCSSYVGEYMRQFGFPVNGPWNPEGEHTNPFPWSNVVAQVDWLRSNYPNSVTEYPLINFLNGDLWDKISPGSLVYLQTAVGHNGYNTYYHVTVLVGYHNDGNPQFAEFAGEMKTGASSNRTFWELTDFYSKLPGGGWDVRSFDTGIRPLPELQVTVFDVLSAIP